MEEESFIVDYAMVFQRIYRKLNEAAKYKEPKELKEKILECDKILCRHFIGLEFFGLNPSEQHLQGLDNLVESINILEKK